MRWFVCALDGALDALNRWRVRRRLRAPPASVVYTFQRPNDGQWERDAQVWLTHSQKFLKAARLLFAEGFDGTINLPAYHAAGHAAELALKAFLVHRGCDLRALRRVDHDLVEAIHECERRGLDLVSSLPEFGREMIATLNTVHSDPDSFRYPTRLPALSLLDAHGTVDLVERLSGVVTRSIADGK